MVPINHSVINYLHGGFAKPLQGQLLAVAFSNGFLHLTSSHTGKVTHQIDCSTYSTSQICCLGWGVSFIDSPSLSKQLESLRDKLTLNDVISGNPQIDSLDTLPDLPLDLAFLDVENLLPKLSPLSSGGIEYVLSMFN